MSDIFICYSRTDSTVASQLVERLRAEGWSVFRDVQTHVGKRWHKEIEKELHAAKAVVVLWSARSRDSDYVLEEAQYGKLKEILFPAFIEDVEFPYGFGRIQTADLIGWAGDEGHHGLAGVIESLKEHLNSREATPGAGDVLHAEGVVTSKLDPRQRRGERRPDRSALRRFHARHRAEAPKPVQPALAQTFRDADGPLMVVIPAGRFRMGSPADEPERTDYEGPQHEVCIAAPFAMGMYAVTFYDYERFCDDTKLGKPEDQGWGRGRRPVINVSWEAARDYCAWLGEQTGRAYRLPSEAEWEYACRAGTDTPFHFGPRITTDQANFDGNYTYNGSAKGEYRAQTVPVGSFPPNAFGLYDMHGNVWEWCQDTWHDSYKGAPHDGSAWGRGEKESRVARGGSWRDFPRFCCAAAPRRSPPGVRYGFIGFRVCCTVPIE
jgi:formylglycine-generating enzyme required for sulfatase activity